MSEHEQFSPTAEEDAVKNALPEIPKKRSNTSKILIIGAGLAFFCVCIIPVCVIVVLALLGPAIGNVFSEIIEELEATPTPGVILSIGFMPVMVMNLVNSPRLRK